MGDSAAYSVGFKMMKADFIHVLLNILSNSVQNLLDNQIPDPKITIQLEEKNADNVVLSIRDNGTGLDAQRFEQLTSFVYPPSEQGAAREGLACGLPDDWWNVPEVICR